MCLRAISMTGVAASQNNVPLCSWVFCPVLPSLWTLITSFHPPLLHSLFSSPWKPSFWGLWRTPNSWSCLIDVGSKLTGKGSKGETGEGQDIALFLTKARAEHSLRVGNRTPELGRYCLVHSHGSAQLGGPPSLVGQWMWQIWRGRRAELSRTCTVFFTNTQIRWVFLSPRCRSILLAEPPYLF